MCLMLFAIWHSVHPGPILLIRSKVVGHCICSSLHFSSPHLTIVQTSLESTRELAALPSMLDAPMSCNMHVAKKRFACCCRDMGRSLSLQDGHMIIRSGSMQQSQSGPSPRPQHSSSFNRRNTTGSQPSPRTSTSGGASQDQPHPPGSGKPPLSPSQQQQQSYPAKGICGSIETSGEAESIAGGVSGANPLYTSPCGQMPLFTILRLYPLSAYALMQHTFAKTCCTVQPVRNCSCQDSWTQAMLEDHLQAHTVGFFRIPEAQAPSFGMCWTS